MRLRNAQARVNELLAEDRRSKDPARKAEIQRTIGRIWEGVRMDRKMLGGNMPSPGRGRRKPAPESRLHVVKEPARKKLEQLPMFEELTPSALVRTSESRAPRR